MTGTQRWLYSVWYDNGAGGWILRPLEWLFRSIVAIRRMLYRQGIFTTQHLDVPVVVVGNLAVGGGGKTPLVGWLVSELRDRGCRVAIVSRGYGGEEPARPLRVGDDVTAARSGDEAKMLAESTGAPVFVCRDRVAAARAAQEDGAELIVADDGLQHYRLGRAMEIVVIDAARGQGNTRCLPAGPLREPMSRLSDVDLIVGSGGEIPGVSEISYSLTIQTAVNGESGVERDLETFSGQHVHAVAGIAHPTRFVDALERFGIRVNLIPVGDHQVLERAELNPSDELDVLMTEKDAVKYQSLEQRHWIVPARVVFAETKGHALVNRLLSLTTEVPVA
ncbi:MAG: tetraacyldisaccharide 4'-kinase [Pseudomonadota bacterium]